MLALISMKIEPIGLNPEGGGGGGTGVTGSPQIQGYFNFGFSPLIHVLWF